MAQAVRRYLNVRAAALYLGIGEDQRAIDTLYQWVHRGRVPHIKIGRTLRFDTKALDALMEGTSRPATEGYAHAKKSGKP